MKNIRKKSTDAVFLTGLVLTVFCFLSPVYGQNTPRSPIDVNLIIDGSNAFAASKDEITSWTCTRLDQILINGDRVTVWNAGASARVIYTGTISGDTEKEAVKRSIREFQASGNNADFSGALREASGRQSSTFSYTLLISASQDTLSSLLSGPQANLLRFSRIEEFSTWRALVVGLNIDSRVRSAASAYVSQ
jgi:hypothetical protein